MAVVSVKDSLKNTELVFIKDRIKFTGEYRITIPASLITIVELWVELPKIEKCIKGRTRGNSIKSDFRIAVKGDCRLFIKKNNPPYIYIELINGQKIVYNMTERLLTYKLLNQIWDAMDAC